MNISMEQKNKGAIFLSTIKTSKSGKEYIPGVLEINGQKYRVCCYQDKSAKGVDYLSLSIFEDKGEYQKNTSDLPQF